MRRFSQIAREDSTVKRIRLVTTSIAMTSIATLALLALAAAFNPAAAQQDYPNRPLHVYIGFPAGSGADILGRYFTAQLEKLAGKPVVVENKPGANSNIAAGMVANAKPDGYSILFIASSNMAGSRFLFKNLPFDTVKDFTPVASFAEIAFVLTVGAKSPIKSVSELTADLKSRKQAKYGATNQTAILTTEYYKQIAGVEAVHVAYRTAPEALPDVEDGTLDFMVMDGTFAVGPIKAGKIRALAVTTAQRIPSLPDVPTMKEAGVGGFEFSPWWGAFVPAATPQPIVAKLGAWMNQIARTEETRQFLERVAALPLSDDSKAAAARLQGDIEKWGPLVKAAKIEPQ
jgi:tripartite-type tricarboxylate transporter receptor subunit TctC